MELFVLLFYAVFILTVITGVAAILVFIYVVTNIIFILFVTKVPPISTDRKYFEKIFQQVKIIPETIIYDLGCGNGNFILEASKFQPKKCVGYELSFFPYLSAKIKARLFGRGRIEILFKDFFGADIGDADLVYVYLVPPLLGRVAQKLKYELKPGSVAMVKGMPLPELEYVNKIVLDEKRKYFAYVYKF